MNALIQHLKNPKKTLTLVPNIQDLLMDNATSVLVDRVVTIYRRRNDPNIRANGWFFATSRRFLAEFIAKQEGDSVVLLQLQPGIRVLHLPTLLGENNPLLPDTEYIISSDNHFEPLGKHGFRVRPIHSIIPVITTPRGASLGVEEVDINTIARRSYDKTRRRRRFKTQKNRRFEVYF